VGLRPQHRMFQAEVFGLRYFSRVPIKTINGIVRWRGRSCNRVRSMDLTPEQFARIKRLFGEALKLSLPLRDAFLLKIHEEHGATIAHGLEALLAAPLEPTESIPKTPVEPDASLPFARLAFQEGDLIWKRFRIIRLLILLR
jgi:hypothetical protein